MTEVLFALTKVHGAAELGLFTAARDKKREELGEFAERIYLEKVEKSELVLNRQSLQEDYVLSMDGYPFFQYAFHHIGSLRF